MKNEIENKELKEYLGDIALSGIQQGVEYNNLAGLTLEFGYLFDIDDRGIEALFKVITDIGTFYFVVQKNSLMKIDITEDMFVHTTEQFLKMHG